MSYRYDLHGNRDHPSGLSQLGLVLFIVGAELRLPGGGRNARAALAVGVLAVVLPILLALVIAPMLHASFAPAGVGFWPFALLLASAVAITAMPVMARIPANPLLRVLQ